MPFENLADLPNPKANRIRMFAKPPGHGGFVPTFFFDHRAQTPELGTKLLPDFREGNLTIEAWFQERQDDPCGVILLSLRAGFDRVDMDLVNPWPVPQKVGGVVPESRPEIVFPLPDTTLGFGFELRELSEKFGFQVFPLFGSELASNLSEQLQLFPQLHSRGIKFPTL